MEAVNIDVGIEIDPGIRAIESFAVRITGLLTKNKLLKWYRPSRAPHHYGIRAAKGAKPPPLAAVLTIVPASIREIRVRSLPGMAAAKGRYSFAVTAYDAANRVIGESGMLLNAKV